LQVVLEIPYFFFIFLSSVFSNLFCFFLFFFSLLFFLDLFL
jgi:hypothetical protein